MLQLFILCGASEEERTKEGNVFNFLHDARTVVKTTLLCTLTFMAWDSTITKILSSLWRRIFQKGQKEKGGNPTLTRLIYFEIVGWEAENDKILNTFQQLDVLTVEKSCSWPEVIWQEPFITDVYKIIHDCAHVWRFQPRNRFYHDEWAWGRARAQWNAVCTTHALWRQRADDLSMRFLFIVFCC